MRSILSLSVPKRTAARLTRVARTLGVPRSLLVRQALDRFVLDVELEELRSRLRPYAVARGIVTDEDVFRRVS